MKVRAILGLAGVAEDENIQAVRLGHALEGPMLLVAVWAIIEWYAEATGVMPRSVAVWTDWVVWLFFVIETAILSYLVRDKARYLRTNWMNLAIILMGIPVLWGSTVAMAMRILRLVFMLSLLAQFSRTLIQVLSRNRLGTTLFVALVVILLSGLVIAGIDPAINTVWDGVWWAWITVTTVGYGDMVPASAAGKLFGAFLILLGLGLISLLTASFSAFFISREEEKISEQERRVMRQLDDIKDRLDHIERHLHDLPRKDA